MTKPDIIIVPTGWNKADWHAAVKTYHELASRGATAEQLAVCLTFEDITSDDD